MNSIYNQIKATIAVAAVSSVATFANIPSANAALFGLNWEGDQGYSAQGKFSYSDSLEGTVVTGSQLNTFSLSFFNPTGDLLKTFAYNFSSPTTTPSFDFFNFNFDTVTESVLQSGSYDTSTGFDLGSNFNTDIAGLFFYTFQDADQGLPTTTIFLNDGLSTEVCIQSGNCGLDFGGQLTANKIPEPGTIFGLLVLGSAVGFLKKKSAVA
ncbi:PEP-CTERM sorting domain-containing protein [Anabaena sp. UHCC 0253]|uniref:PEP-CTERM sorting domain-containing protein n=1 Tax=Anabaena sp. UHCC 0253 TaxID=2590019 RepID=UPI0014465395|nr:PEP-CTERM sorting domain-containing protein [Anabaena sp. UHCC 0253]MTJ52240.1 PEP-CTERM sorting domain-containing protein [Anabaena sp. UHCC 0253]